MARVFCGLSGGVDSALAAVPCSWRPGHDVTAVYMRNWSQRPARVSLPVGATSSPTRSAWP